MENLILQARYYTPEIEEFHIGFEYEHKLHLIEEINDEGKSTKVLEGDWKKDTFKYPFYHQGLLNFPNYFRVKYLDKQDIEELGWVHKNNAAHGYHEFKGKYCQEENFVWYELLWIEPISHIEIYTRKAQDRKAAFYDIGDFFRGTIKNKSELKKLMEQLGI